MKINRNSFYYKFFRLFTDNNIPASAAEMAYYLLFAFFPILMVVYASMSLAGKSGLVFIPLTSPLLPESVQELLDSFLQHIGSQSSNLSFLFAGIFLTIISVSRFTKSVKAKVRMIYGSRTYASPLTEWIVSFTFSVLLLVVFYVTLFVMIMGEHLMNIIAGYVPVSEIVHRLLLILRYFVTGFVVLAVLTFFYYIIPNVRNKLGDVIVGTLFTLTSWILVSLVFTYYINNIAAYSVVYGSLGAFIILLVWFYITSMLLLVGSIINCIVYHGKRRRLIGREGARHSSQTSL